MSAPAEATGTAFARAALLGNPSDGFGGKTIGVTVRELAAQATLTPAPAGSAAAADAELRPLIEATIARFRAECGALGIEPRLEHAVELETEIPRQVGLGGSSALVIATFRALFALDRIEVEPDRLAELALAVETEDLGIPAGLQDRVIQAHDGLVYMDFAPGVERPYERLDRDLLPALFIAYRPDASEPSAAVHADLRRRFERREAEVLAALEEIAALAAAGRTCLLEGDHDELGRLMVENVAARARLVELDPRHLGMVDLARSLGCPANYAGSGGAIVGLLAGRAREGEVRDAFAAEGCQVLVPT